MLKRNLSYPALCLALFTLGSVVAQAQTPGGFPRHVSMVAANEGAAIPDGSVQATAFVISGQRISERAGVQRDVRSRNIAQQRQKSKTDLGNVPNTSRAGIANDLAQYLADSEKAFLLPFMSLANEKWLGSSRNVGITGLLQASKLTVAGNASIGKDYYNTAAPPDGMIIEGTLGVGTTTPGSKLTVAGVIQSTSGGFKFPDGTTQLTAAAGGGTGGVSNVTASAPLASSGGATPNISLTGLVGIANGGTGTSGSPSAAGQYLRSTGAGSWGVGAIAAGDLPSLPYVAKAGDTMTGALNLPANGLVAGTNQLVLSGGKVGIGTANPVERLDIRGTSNAVTVQIGDPLTGSSDPKRIIFGDSLYVYIGESGNDDQMELNAANGYVFNGGSATFSGMIFKNGGGFKIDHPLDPANKYLYHSFVESPEMKNIYDGTVKLDDNGEAVIVLPAWFEAVNKDFRYQLTCIGGYAQVYVAEEVKDNQFKIAGGRPGLKVSWQVTGVRQDPGAEKNRIPVEEDKVGQDKGKYLHPELYGRPDQTPIGTTSQAGRASVKKK